MPQSAPLVSIGIPTFNRSSTIRRAIESVLAQDYHNIELVISDNASTDGTTQLCEGYARRDNRVRYARLSVNRGPTANFVEVLHSARGEFFMWLGDDDWIEPSYVACCVKKLTADPELALVAGRARSYNGTVVVRDGTPIDLCQDQPIRRVLAYFARVQDNSTFYGVMRRTIPCRVPLRDTMGNDWILIAAVAFLGKIRTVEDVFIHRAWGGTSASKRRIVGVLQLSRWQAVLPTLAIALAAFEDIAIRNSIYRTLSPGRRLAFGLVVFLDIILHKGVIQNLKRLIVSSARFLLGEEAYRRLRSSLVIRARH